MKVDWYLVERIGRIGLKMIVAVITELIRVVDMQAKEARKRGCA